MGTTPFDPHLRGRPERFIGRDDLARFSPVTKRTLIIGDTHGCLTELQMLLDAMSYCPSSDRVILAGDIMDRGPDPVGCVRFARENGFESVLGNHDEKHVRWRQHEAVRAQTGRTNPMRSMTPERIAQNEQLSEEDVTWLKALPSFIELSHRYVGSHALPGIPLPTVVVHAGFAPSLPIPDQPRDRVIRTRWLDLDGSYISLQTSLEQPPETVFWTELWNQPVNVVYGHVVQGDHALISTRASGATCWGIDTGCVFGGYLTGLVLTEDPTFYNLVQVKALRTYVERPTLDD